MYVIVRIDDLGKEMFLSREARWEKTYTDFLQKAKMFKSVSDADADRCIVSERVVSVESIMKGE